MNCPACGAENPEGSTFCNLCLANFAGGSPQPQPGPPPPPQGAGPPGPPEVYRPPGAQQAPGAPPGGMRQSPGMQPPPGMPPPPGAQPGFGMQQQPGMPPPPGMPPQAMPPPPGMPPQAMQPPPGMPPPGYGSPSDAFAYGTPRPLPQTRPARGPSSPLVKVVAVLSFVVFFAAGWFAMDWFLTRPKTFTSQAAGFSFQYPGKWKKINDTGFNTSFGVASGGVPSTTEVLLADGTNDSNTSNFLAVVTVPNIPTSWETTKNKIADSTSDIASGMPAGSTTTTPVYTDLTVAGNPAASAKMSVTAMGLTMDFDITMLQKGSTLYIFEYIALKPKGDLGKLKGILDTVKLTK